MSIEVVQKIKKRWNDVLFGLTPRVRMKKRPYFFFQTMHRRMVMMEE